MQDIRIEDTGDRMEDINVSMKEATQRESRKKRKGWFKFLFAPLHFTNASYSFTLNIPCTILVCINLSTSDFIFYLLKSSICPYRDHIFWISVLLLSTSLINICDMTFVSIPISSPPSPPFLSSSITISITISNLSFSLYLTQLVPSQILTLTWIIATVSGVNVHGPVPPKHDPWGHTSVYRSEIRLQPVSAYSIVWCSLVWCSVMWCGVMWGSTVEGYWYYGSSRDQN